MIDARAWRWHNILAALLQFVLWVSPGCALVVLCRLPSARLGSLVVVLWFLFWCLLEWSQLNSSVEESFAAARAIITLQRTYEISEHFPFQYIDRQTVAEMYGADFRVFSARPVSAEGTLDNLIAYPNPTRTSVVILPDPPDKIGPFQKFFLYHEVGHVSLTGAASVTFTKVVAPRVIAMYLPTVFLTSDWITRLFIIVAAAARLALETQEILGETAADYFAASRLLRAAGLESLSTGLRIARLNIKRNLESQPDGDKGTRLGLLIQDQNLTRYQQIACSDKWQRLLPSAVGVDPTIQSLGVFLIVITLVQNSLS